MGTPRSPNILPTLQHERTLVLLVEPRQRLVAVWTKHTNTRDTHDKNNNNPSATSHAATHVAHT